MAAAGGALKKLLGHDYRSFVYPLLGTGAVGAEIGVWKGDFSAELLRRVSPSKLYLVDPWAFVTKDGYEDAMYGGKVAQSQADMDAIHEGVRARFSAEIAGGVVEVLRGGSAEIVGELEDGSLDWAYVDGDHTYDAVTFDLAAWWPKVRSGGLLLGDDYGEAGKAFRRVAPWWGNGVTKAVDEFVAANGLQPVAIKHGQFVLRKP
ncbi:MAG TPA: class I SAM-dependent methyltransferase [Acidimicrobiales bacterium]|nr:class I SAM-dependent methyltransferase [Acidimicrobiales bacterium]